MFLTTVEIPDISVDIKSIKQMLDGFDPVSLLPSIDTLVIIANALNVGLDALLRDSLKVPIRLDPSGGLSRKDIGVQRTYLSNQQAALEKWDDGSRRK